MALREILVDAIGVKVLNFLLSCFSYFLRLHSRVTKGVQKLSDMGRAVDFHDQPSDISCLKIL